MLAVAFKEWAVICRALAEGRQALILRKGGITEDGGVFKPEHTRFWLYPTFFHEHQSGIRPEMQPLLAAAEANRPEAGVVRLSHFADVANIHFIKDLEVVRRLAPCHGWTDEVIAQRFHYRSPGLYVLTVRIHEVFAPADIPERPEYAGCKTWVLLDKPISTIDSKPVLSETAFQDYAQRVSDAIRPTSH